MSFEPVYLHLLLLGIIRCVGIIELRRLLRCVLLRLLCCVLLWLLRCVLLRLRNCVNPTAKMR